MTGFLSWFLLFFLTTMALFADNELSELLTAPIEDGRLIFDEEENEWYFCEEDELPPEIELNLKSAIWWALNHNRQIINAQDGAIKTGFQVTIAKSDFELSIKPNADLGYIGGGSGGPGAAYGLGIEFSKKLACGTRISVTPSTLKAGKIYHSNVKSYITQPLLRGFGKDYTLAGLRGAEFSLRTTLRTVYTTQCTLILRTITSLYEILKAQKTLAVAEESYNRIKKFHQAAIVKARLGLTDPLDVYRAEIELQHSEDTFKATQDRLQEAKDALRDLLALPPEIELRINVPTYYTSFDMPIENAINIAVQNRIEIDQAMDQKRENERLAKLAKERLWPELNMVVNYSNIAQDQVFSETWKKKRESSWGVGFTTSTDFSPTAERLAYKQSLMAIETAQRGVDQAIANVSFDVKRNIRSLDRAYERILMQEKLNKTVETQLHLAQLKFDRGFGNNFDLIQAEKALRSAELSYWNALIDHIVGEYQLKVAMGLLMEKPCL